MTDKLDHYILVFFLRIYGNHECEHFIATYLHTRFDLKPDGKINSCVHGMHISYELDLSLA